MVVGWCETHPGAGSRGEEYTLFEGFSLEHVDVGEVTLRVRYGGHGQPVVLLHGHPRTHTTWHRLAPQLAGSKAASAVPRSRSAMAPWSERSLPSTPGVLPCGRIAGASGPPGTASLWKDRVRAYRRTEDRA